MEVREPIEKPDPANDDPRYWEKVLASHGLDMNQGLDPKLIYVGSLPDLQRIEERNARKATGRVTPGGYGPK